MIFRIIPGAILILHIYNAGCDTFLHPAIDWKLGFESHDGVDRAEIPDADIIF